MIKNGARYYVLKDCKPHMLTRAIRQLLERGYYYSELVSVPGALRHPQRDRGGVGKGGSVWFCKGAETGV